jgi:hypothetical protein
MVTGRKNFEAQTVGEVIKKKPERAEIVEVVLGKIWCPLKGMECMNLDENIFPFTFKQLAGKRRTMEDGPWMIGSDNLVVVAYYDADKTIDEIEFTSIPVWVRVSKMQLGLMNKSLGEMKLIAEVMEVDAEEDEIATRQFFRIKIYLDSCKPLMRCVMSHP